MSRWDELSGEKGEPIQSGRIGRALKLGGLAGRLTSAALRAGLGSRKASAEEKLQAQSDAMMRHAQHVVSVMGQMKGAAMKVGQMLSTDPELLSPEFAHALTGLQKSAPPMTWATLEAQVEQALDRPISAVFSYFDPEPLGAASIGQVHRARLHDGREVAVKIQYPGVAASLEADLKNLGMMLKVGGRVLLSKERAQAFIDEARAAILMEADYLQEAQNLLEFRELLRDMPQVILPEPYMEWCRPTLLVMAFMPGTKLDEALLAIEDREKRNALAARFVEVFFRLFHEKNHLHGDPHPGNFLIDDQERLVLLDFGCVRRYEPRWGEGMLRTLRAYWARDWAALARVYRELGFGQPNTPYPKPEVLEGYHDLVLAPFREDAPFAFAQWPLHTESRRFVRQNLEMLRMTPPAPLLLYFRVLMGIKGILSKVEAEVNMRALAEGICDERGIEC